MLFRLQFTHVPTTQPSTREICPLECTTTSQAHFGEKIRLESCLQFGPIWALFHLQQTPVMGTCGQLTDGRSRQSGPLAMFQTQGEDSGEEESEADMSEERNAKEGGKVNIYVRDKEKNNCTTHETSLREFHFRMFLRPL